MGDEANKLSPSLADLPSDELAAYGNALGLALDPRTPEGELLRLIRGQHELLLELDRDAMLDIVVWARLPVRRSAGKEALARHIAGITKLQFEGLSDRGLSTLARLRGLEIAQNEDRKRIERKLRRHAGLWARWRQKRRSAIGALISRAVEGSGDEGEYLFLPESGEDQSLKGSIEDAGVVGGIAQKLRGAADRYVHEKLDEIEKRVDRKLDEIDRRLSEWRDREISNRLRIVKITLIATILVAIISLGYDYVKSRSHRADPVPGSVAETRESESPR